MQAILVKYLPATNHRCARFKAIAAAGTLTVSAHKVPDYAHPQTYVARMLVTRRMSLAPDCELLYGTLPNGDTAVVFDHPSSRKDFK
jgi:hypothetical protein